MELPSAAAAALAAAKGVPLPVDAAAFVKRPARQQRLQQLQVWLRNRGRRLFVPLLTVLLCASVVAWRAVMWTRSPFFPVAGAALPAAKCFVTIAEVCFGLMFLPVSRNLVTWLRGTWLRHVIDFDANLSYHKVLGIVGALAGIAHGICITVAYNAAHVLQHGNCGSCWWAWTSGWLLLALLLVTYPFAGVAVHLRDSRAGKVLNSFTNFWLSHHVLILIFTPLLLVHSIPAAPAASEGSSLTASKGWLFLAVPVLIYAVERATRWMRNVVRRTSVLDARLLPGDVLELTLSKPRNFRYTSGAYVYIKCCEVSSFESHPFTITSAPADAFITLHIKKAGDWTAALHELFAQRLEAGHAASAAAAGCRPHQPVQTASSIGSSCADLDIVLELQQLQAAAVAAAAARRDGAGGSGGAQHAPSDHGSLRPQAPPSLHIVEEDGASSCAGSATDGVHHTGWGPVARIATMRSALFKDVESSEAELSLCGRPLPELALDGPYGAPTQEWSDYNVITLIGGGIGITPMASVLRTLLHNLYDACCDNCGHINRRAAHIRQRRVYFHHVLRDAEEMRWFQQVLAAIAEADLEGRFDLHVHITGPSAAAAPVLIGEGGGSPHHGSPHHLGGGGIKAASRVHYSAGRPDFGAVLSSIQANHPGEVVGVFFCGSPALASTLEGECRRLNRRVLAAAAAGRRPTGQGHVKAAASAVGGAACPAAGGCGGGSAWWQRWPCALLAARGCTTAAGGAATGSGAACADGRALASGSGSSSSSGMGGAAQPSGQVSAAQLEAGCVGAACGEGALLHFFKEVF